MLRDEKYRAFIRQHPCCGCYCPADDAHHYGKRYAGGGMGVKPHDTFEVPLCRGCHDHYHRDGALPGMARDDTERHFLINSLQLLTEYLMIGARGKNASIPRRGARA